MAVLTHHCYIRNPYIRFAIGISCNALKLSRIVSCDFIYIQNTIISCLEKILKQIREK